MTLKIQAIVNGKLMSFVAEKTEATDTTETYNITIRDHSITLQTNRLLFKEKNLKHRKGTWKVLEGVLRIQTPLIR